MKKDLPDCWCLHETFEEVVTFKYFVTFNAATLKVGVTFKYLVTLNV